MKSQRIAVAAAILFAASAQAAAISTTLTMTNAPITISSDFSTATVSGPVTLTNIGNGTLKGSIALASLFGSATISTPYTITLSGGDTILGVVSFPSSALSGTGTGSATVTGGTGAYAGSTGSFPALTATGSFSGVSGTLSLTGAGTITPNGGGASGPPPNITAVLDAGSYTPNIAQGSIFVVKGTGLSASGYTPFAFPLPASSAGVSISFAPTSGAATQAFLIYLYNQSGVNQLAAVLPSTVATGNYKVTVTNGTQTSTPFSVQVVARKPELITADGSGTGLAVLQNYVSASQLDVNRFTTGSVGGFTISPAHPGQTEIAYLVGTGADPGPDNQASPGYNFLNNGVTVQVLVGNMTLNASYEGRVAGGSGYEQVNFVLPNNVPTGCTVPFQLNVNGTLSAPTFIAIAPDAGSSACVQPGFTTSQLQGFDQGNVYYYGVFGISQNNFSGTESDGASGSFIKYTGSQLSAIPANASFLSNFQSGCFVSQLISTPGQGASGAGVALDAGSVTLTGPGGSGLSNTLFTQLGGAYLISIGGQGGVNAKIVPGTYTINGAGGADVGKFSASLTLPSPLTVTGGLPSVVVRNNGLPLSWTGGNGPDLVVISGEAAQVSSSGAASGASFVCLTTAGAGGFTVPASILNQLPTVSAADIAAFKAVGSLQVTSAGQPATFSAPLTAGGSINPSFFLGSIGTGDAPTYQ